MLDTLGVVELPLRRHVPDAETGSIPLTRRKLGGKPLVAWIVRRVTESQRLDGVIVVIGDRPESRWPVDLVPPDVPIFYGKQADPLACFNAALREYPARAVVRVSADSPFVDPVLIDRLVNTAEDHPNGDYIGYRFGDGRPVIQSRLGVVAEWCQTAALVQADRETADPLDRQQVTRYLYSHPEKFLLRLLPVPSELDRNDLRLTSGVDEDYEHAQEIYDALGPESLDWQRIAGLLHQQPALRRRMAFLNRNHVGV